MNESIISIENLSKRYLIGNAMTAGDGLRHKMEKAVRAPLKWLNSRLQEARTGRPEFWALKEINFNMNQGEVIGIIGRNGAGKSTLLKVLSRITEPTTGRIRIRGRVASLLEVGTGFHPELTGRENIYLNGAILGMSRAEIKNKFDEIIAFSEISKFIDTPVKHYSSGMYVRLAFAVAAHLEPDILIVDEVLAVGDFEFQKKCLGKMEDVANRNGRTVIFVSHNMAAVQNLCGRGILLDQGRLLCEGRIGTVIEEYVNRASNLSRRPLEDREDRSGKGHVRITQLEILDGSGNPLSAAVTGASLMIRLFYRVSHGMRFNGNCTIDVCIERHMKCMTILSTAFPDKTELLLEGQGHVDFEIDELPLSEAVYSITTYAHADGVTQDWVQDAAELHVVGGDFYGTGKNCHPGWNGEYVLIKHRWMQHPSR